MNQARTYVLACIAALTPVAAQAGDGMDARANAGRPMRLQVAGDTDGDKSVGPASGSLPDTVVKWTTVATRVSSISDAPVLDHAPLVEAENAATKHEGKTLPRTLARRDSGGTQSAPSPLDVFRTAPTRSLLPLGVTVGAIALLAVAFRKWAPRPGRMGGMRVIQVLSRHALSNKHSLCLVRIGQGLVLLGLSPERIATLIEIRDPEEVSRILGTARSGQNESFSATLRGLARLPAPTDEVNNAIEPDRALPAAKLSNAGATVRDLVSRVRQFSGAAAATGTI